MSQVFDFIDSEMVELQRCFIMKRPFALSSTLSLITKPLAISFTKFFISKYLEDDLQDIFKIILEARIFVTTLSITF